jgi:hypothetical protein
MLIETSPVAVAIPPVTLPTRQVRFEERVARAISTGCPRSTIREAVEQLVDQLRWQNVQAARGVAIVMDVASRAGVSETRAFDSQADCLTLVARWATHRYAQTE